ncbi:hypothetical protein [Tetrasphaera phage TJE1]|uniref:Uncharacterized protein n=1 Tax=Tetrasphaera phage TJE1 TaxID=981335 RepID=G4W993_9CAUD|nr:hypothetical protein G185_gp61 [Tetrasphaera phage TJE1]ADX42581.1 hypothetical protein [Tetrasphaera phage TJE1]
MNPAEMIRSLETFYGTPHTPRYIGMDLEIISSYIRKAFDAKGHGFLDQLFEQVTLDVSKSYGKLPDKAQLNEAAKKILPKADPNALPPPPKVPPVLSDQEAYNMELELRALAARNGKPMSDERIKEFGDTWAARAARREEEERRKNEDPEEEARRKRAIWVDFCTKRGIDPDSVEGGSK